MGRILVVDDEQGVLSILVTLLKTDGHEVVPALGGDVATKVLREDDQFDLMLSDIRMSPVTGMDLLHLVHDRYSGIVVILLTAYGQVDTAIEAMELGAFDYVKKPFHADEILLTVRKALDYGKMNQEPIG